MRAAVTRENTELREPSWAVGLHAGETVPRRSAPPKNETPTVSLAPRRSNHETPTVALAAIEVEALLHRAEAPIEGDAPTVEMLPVIAPDPPEPPRLARGSDSLRPRRRRTALSSQDIKPRK
jgi:hypothetical protein